MMSTIKAFEAASGVSPHHLSLYLRSVLCVSFFMWAAWNVYGLVRWVQNHSLDIHDMPLCLLRILFLTSLVVILVFVN